MLLQLGLKSLLYTLIKQDGEGGGNDKIVLPLSLKTLFSHSALKEGSYLLEEQGCKKISPAKVANNVTLPMPLDVHPSHGKTVDLFKDGCPGLI